MPAVKANGINREGQHRDHCRGAVSLLWEKEKVRRVRNDRTHFVTALRQTMAEMWQCRDTRRESGGAQFPVWLRIADTIRRAGKAAAIA